MRIQLSNKQLQLIQEALKDEIPQYMQDIIQKRHGDKFLDMDVPEHTQLIPEVTKEILDDEIKKEMINKIDIHFRNQIDSQWEKTKIIRILMASYHSEDRDMSSRRRTKYEYKFDGGILFYNLILGSLSDFEEPFLKENFYSKGFKLLQSKNNNVENPIYSDNKSNLYSFLVSIQRAFPEYFKDINPISITTEKTFSGLRNAITNQKQISQNLKNSKFYLHISSKPYDILRMSVSDFYDSCQNLYSGGVHGTEFNKKLLSNVFDKNSKVAFLLYDAPFTDNMGNKHPNSPIARMIIRTNPKGGILFDSVYPHQMQDKMHKIVTDLTGLQNTGIPGQLYHYTNIEGLPEPYMDTYTIKSLASRSPRALVLAKYLGVDVNNIQPYSNNTFNIDKNTYTLHTLSEITEYLRDFFRRNIILGKTSRESYIKNAYKIIANMPIYELSVVHKIIPIQEIYSELGREYQGAYANLVHDRTIDLQREVRKFEHYLVSGKVKNNREWDEIKNEIEKINNEIENEKNNLKNDDKGILEYMAKKFNLSNLDSVFYGNSMSRLGEDFINNHLNVDALIKAVYGTKLEAIKQLLPFFNRYNEFNSKITPQEVKEITADNEKYYLFIYPMLYQHDYIKWMGKLKTDDYLD